MPHKAPAPGPCADCGRVGPRRNFRLCWHCYAARRDAGTLPVSRPPPVCQACGAPVTERRAQYCRPCYRVRLQRGLGRRVAPEAVPTEGPCRCTDCGERFVAAIVRSAHSFYGVRCLSGAELAARGWRRTPGGWAWPAPDTVHGGVDLWAHPAREEQAT